MKLVPEESIAGLSGRQDGSAAVDKAPASSFRKVSLITGSPKLHIFIVLLGGLLSFLPLILGSRSFLETDSLRQVIVNSYVQNITSAITLTLMVPLAVDRLMDIFQSYLRKMCGDEDVAVTTADYLTNIELFTVLMGFSIEAIIILYVNTTATEVKSAVYLVVCAWKCRFTSVLGIMAASISRNIPNYFPPIIITFVLISLVIAMTLSTFTGNLMIANYTIGIKLDRARLAISVIAVVPCLVMALVWIFKMLLKSMEFKLFTISRWISGLESPEETSNSRTREAELRSAFATNKIGSTLTAAVAPAVCDPYQKISSLEDRWFQTAYVSVVVVCVVIIFAIFGSIGDVINLTSSSMALAKSSFILLELSLLILTLRKSKSEVVKGLVALLDSKKRYIRYLSHELRTPINASALGLRLLKTELVSTVGLHDAELVDTVLDVEKSLAAAVEILDSLLCFDKLEDGILELRKQRVNVLNFLDETVLPFMPQARASGINLVLTTAPAELTTERRKGSLTGAFIKVDSLRSLVSAKSRRGSVRAPPKQTGLPLEEDDTISMDKFKMAQVVRNLVSNALKFSPHNTGIVTVNATFIPNKDLQMSQDRDSTAERVGANAQTEPAQSVDRRAGLKKRISSHFRSIGRAGSVGRGALGAPWKNSKSKPSCTLRITVTDSGVGISPENQKRLFTEIVQFNPEILQAGGGSGFGLLIAKGIVDLHGGKISVYSEGEGKGTTFTVDIPMERKLQRNRNSSGALADPTEPARPEAAGETRLGTIVNPIINHDSPNPRVHLNANSAAAALQDVAGEAGGGPVGVPADVDVDVGEDSSTMNVLVPLKLLSGDCPVTLEGETIEKMDNNDAPRKALRESFNNAKEQGLDQDPRKCKGVDVNIEGDKDAKAATDVNVIDRSSSASRRGYSNIANSRLAIRASHSGLSKIESKLGLESLVKYSGPKYRILIVDDSHLSRKMLRKALVAVGHACEEAEDGSLALAKMKPSLDSGAGEYDVILMDFVMPNMDGPTATREIRKLGYKGPIFGVTGNTVDSDIRAFTEAGVNKVFPKPFDVDHFHDTMNETGGANATAD